MDEKYHSMVKLMANIKAQLIQRVVHKKLEKDEEMINRGGVMVLQMLESAVEAHYRSAKLARAEEEEQKTVMAGLGW